MLAVQLHTGTYTSGIPATCKQRIGALGGLESVSLLAAAPKLVALEPHKTKAYIKLERIHLWLTNQTCLLSICTHVSFPLVAILQLRWVHAIVSMGLHNLPQKTTR